MKSIVQEASTIAKAVEKGWREAGEPQEFSVKVLELPEHNFIGLTTRSAKIAVMFSDKLARSEHESHHKRSQHKNQPRPEAPRPQKERRPHPEQAQPKPVKVVESSPQPKQQSVKQELRPLQQPSTQKPHEKPAEKPLRKKAEGLWDNALASFVQGWLVKTLQFMESPVTFSVEPQNFYLRITLNKPILPDEAKEKHLLASLSSLMLAATKKEFRKALRGHKIVLTHAQQSQ